MVVRSLLSGYGSASVGPGFGPVARGAWVHLRNDARREQVKVAGPDPSGSRWRDFLAPPDWVGQVSGATFRGDAVAGFTGATIVLPQAVAFAAIAGLPPEYGFYTAMVTPVVAALTGSSWHSVSGPTTATSVLVFAALAGTLQPGSPEFIQAAIALAFLCGLIQLLLGIGRLGSLIEFVSPSVMTGFVAGTALQIALSQLHYVVGVELPRPHDLPAFVEALFTHASMFDARSAVVAATAFGVGFGVRKWRPAWPNYVLALVAATLLDLYLSRNGHTIPVIGAVASAAPHFALPAIGFSTVRDLSSSALAIAMIGLLQDLSVARAVALRSGQPIDGTREIVGQGLSNLVGSFFQCYPGAGSLTRSGANYDAGAKTPLAAVFASLFLFLMLQFVAPWFAHVPTAAMGGVILLVAWRQIDVRELRRLTSTSWGESSIALATLLAALFIDLEFAVYIGVLMSFVFFIRQASRPIVGIGAPDPRTLTHVFKDVSEHALPECPQLLVARLDGALFFGSVEAVRRSLRAIERGRPKQKHMMFVVKGVGEIDLPGADLLIEEARRRQARGGSFHLVTRTPRTIEKLARFKVMRVLGRGHVHLSKGEAIAEVVPLLDQAICATCTARIFRECPPAAPGMTDSADAEQAPGARLAPDEDR